MARTDGVRLLRREEVGPIGLKLLPVLENLVVKFSPLSERLAGLVPPERAGDALTRPGGENRERKLPAARDAGPAPPDTVSSPAELERAQHDLRTALTRFGREAPGRRAIADRPQPPGRLLDIRV